MKITARSEADAQHAAKRTPLPVGWHNVRIEEAGERPSKAGNDMIELTIIVADKNGDKRTFKDYLTNTALGAAKLRHACEAVGALPQYEAEEISASDFPGHECMVHIGIEKKRGFPDRNVIQDYRASASRVVSMRSTG